jgi:hypothetical protein
MSCFKLPRGLCQYINGLLRNFWWGDGAVMMVPENLMGRVDEVKWPASW